MKTSASKCVILNPPQISLNFLKNPQISLYFLKTPQISLSCLKTLQISLYFLSFLKMQNAAWSNASKTLNFYGYTNQQKKYGFKIFFCFRLLVVLKGFSKLYANTHFYGFC